MKKHTIAFKNTNVYYQQIRGNYIVFHTAIVLQDAYDVLFAESWCHVPPAIYWTHIIFSSVRKLCAPSGSRPSRNSY